MLTILVISTIAILVLLLRQRSRIENLEFRLQFADTELPTIKQYEQLKERVDRLERSRPEAAEPVTPAPRTPIAPEIEIIPQARKPERVVAEATATPPDPEPVYKPWPAQPPPAPVPPTLSDRLRAWLGDEEWETLIGGSIVNKIGAVVLVIGIALFLGYSFAHVGPAGRAAISIAVSLTMLAGGMFAETRPRFRIFSRGLIGAGWAALYATAYAIYAIPEARIIDNAFAGSMLLLAVGCGMIGHSLKYRVQAITAVAYFAAFAALAVTPWSPFAVLSLIPLAASILYLASRFGWYPMSVFGAIATYATCIMKSDPHAPLAAGQALLLMYWLLFELFDLLRVHRRVVSLSAEWIFPINAAGFLGISYQAWAGHSPEHLWLASAYAAALYLGSSVARVALRPPSGFVTGEDLMARVRQGSFEGSTIVAAVLAAMAILGRAPGAWSSFGLALEAEALYLAGLSFRSKFLQRFGERSLAISLGRLAWTTYPAVQVPAFGRDVWNFSSGALFHALLFYVNRIVRRSGPVFSTAAATLIAFVLAAELQNSYTGLAWVLFGALLLELGLIRNQLDFRWHGSVLIGGGTIWTVFFHVVSGTDPWQTLAACLAIVYALSLQLHFRRPAGLGDDENASLEVGGAAGIALTASVLLWRLVPSAYLGISWCFLTVVVFELGLRKLPGALRDSLLPMTLLSTFAIFLTHFNGLDRNSMQSAIPTYLTAALCGAVAVVRLRWGRGELSDGDTWIGNAVSALAALAFSIFLWLALPGVWFSVAFLALAAILLETSAAARFPFLKFLVLAETAAALLHVCAVDIPSGEIFATVPLRLAIAPVAISGLYWLRRRFEQLGDREIGAALFWCAFVPLTYLPYAQWPDQCGAWWAATGVALLVYGVYRDDGHARGQAYILSTLALVLGLAFDIGPGHLAVSIPMVVLFYAAHFAAKRTEERYVAEGLSCAATLLLGAVLYGEVSGGMLTVSWGIEGLLLLSSGFPLRNRAFRLQGLALLLICTLKLFLFDLRNLETGYRILSFIGLGLILLSVSWIYTRFRERVRKIL